jgi:hypothetical protein
MTLFLIAQGADVFRLSSSGQRMSMLALFKGGVADRTITIKALVERDADLPTDKEVTNKQEEILKEFIKNASALGIPVNSTELRVKFEGLQKIGRAEDRRKQIKEWVGAALKQRVGSLPKDIPSFVDVVENIFEQWNHSPYLEAAQKTRNARVVDVCSVLGPVFYGACERMLNEPLLTGAKGYIWKMQALVLGYLGHTSY